jgi:ribosomal protein S18 acetylase RimI-like enzyme
MNKDLKIIIKYLDWDSKQLGIHCGLINTTHVRDHSEVERTFNSIKTLIDQNKSIEFLTIKLSQNYITKIGDFVNIGASLIDSELTFLFPRGERKKDDIIIGDYSLDFCDKVEGEDLFVLAEEMQLSRFFLDSNISKDKAINLWKTSIKNHCEGFADELVVAKHNNQLCGIITIKFIDLENINLHIVGVVREHQGRGLGSLMLNKIINQYAERYNIHVETQSVNTSAQKLYQKAGFKFHKLKYVLHHWN